MKEKKEKKLRFQQPLLSKVEEVDTVAKEKQRRKRLGSLGNNLLQERRRAPTVASGNKGRRLSQVGAVDKLKNASQGKPQILKSLKGEEGNRVKTLPKVPKAKDVFSSAKQPATTEKTKIDIPKDNGQRLWSPSPRPASRNEGKLDGKRSPSRCPTPKSGNSPLGKDGSIVPAKSGFAKNVANKSNIDRWQQVKDTLPDLPGRKFLQMCPPSPEEDPLVLPFGGPRKLSDSTLYAAKQATNVVYLINQARKKRHKESIINQIAAIHDRVRKALEHADMFDEDPDNKDEQSQDTKFSTHSKRETMKYRNELVYKMREHIEDCHKRMTLIAEVNNWLQFQQKDMERDLISDEELEETTEEIKTGHKKIMHSLEGLTECTNKISSLGLKIIEIANKIINKPSKAKVEKIQVIDEKTMLSNKAKWDQAMASINGLFEDAARWVKGAQYKSALRTGMKQYKIILSAVDKRLAELHEMSKLVEDLQIKLVMSKEMINKYAKDAEDSRRLVDRLGKELEELQQELAKTVETNKKLTSQLTMLEEQVKEMKAELSNSLTTPQRPPTPPELESSESSKMLMEKWKQQIGQLELQIQEYMMLVKNLTFRIDELEGQLEREQAYVQYLKEHVDKEPPTHERGPEPVISVPTEPAPPSDMVGDPYYKTLLSRMRKDFMIEVDKLKDHMKKEHLRNDAAIRRLEQYHKEQIQSIKKDCLRVLRAIVHFRDQLAITLDKEGFPDAARELQQLPKLVHENSIDQEPKEVLLYMAVNTVDYLQTMEVVMNHTMLAVKVMQKSGTIGSHPPISQEQIFKQMEERMSEIRKPSKIRSVMKSPVKRTKGHSRRKDKNNIKRLEGTVTEVGMKYEGLLERYKSIWKLYNRQKQNIDNIHQRHEQMVRRKVKEKENFMVSAFNTELKERRAVNEDQLQMSIADQRKNLQLLDKAFNENKISKELHQMATNLLDQALEIPRKRFRYLVEHYIAHRAVKDAEKKVSEVLQQEKISSGQRLEITMYMDKMQKRLRSGVGFHHTEMQRLEAVRRGIFGKIWTVFNDILVDTGILLIQPIILQPKKEDSGDMETYTEVRVRKKKKVKTKVVEQQLLGMPTGLVGNTIPLAYNVEMPMWKKQTPSELSPQAAVTTPLILHMDVNQQRLQARRKMQIGPRVAYPIAKSRSFTITDKFQLDYIEMPTCK